ncbi:MAG TPA: ABC transporter substrate-binding protein [Bacilli bacterium]
MKLLIKNSGFTFMILMLSVMIMVSGCSLKKSEKVTLTFWNGFTGGDRPAIEELVKRFNEKFPDITVTMDIQPWDTLLGKLPTSLSTGGPDIVGFNSAQIPRYAKGNLILPVDELYDGDLKGAFPDGLINGLTYNGKIYGAPANFATVMMYYNKDLFTAAGLDANNPPKTWDEWKDAIIKTTKVDGNDKQYGLVLADHATIPMWPSLVWGNGGNFISDDGKKGLMNDEKTVGAYKYWADLVIANGITPTGLTGPEADKLFEAGKAAMEMNGPWATTSYTAAGLNYDVAPVPAGPGGPVTLADMIALVVGKNTKHKEEALKFMEFWNSKESQEYLSLKTGFPPTRSDMLDNKNFDQNPFVLKFSAAAPTARFYLAGLEEYGKINDDVIVPAIQEMTINKKDANAVLAEANTKLETILKGK